MLGLHLKEKNGKKEKMEEKNGKKDKKQAKHMKKARAGVGKPKVCMIIFGGAYSEAKDLVEFGLDLKSLVNNSEVYITGPRDLLQADWYSEYQPYQEDVEWRMAQGMSEAQAQRQAGRYSHTVVDRSWEQVATLWVEHILKIHGRVSKLIFIGISKGGHGGDQHLQGVPSPEASPLAGFRPPCQLPAGRGLQAGSIEDRARLRLEGGVLGRLQ